MAELAADDADVHALGAELGGVRVAEAVGVDPLGDPGPLGQAWQEHARVGRAEGAAVQAAEDRGPGVDPAGPAHMEPRAHEDERPGVHPHRAGAAALPAQHPHGSVGRVDVLQVQRERLGDAKPGAVEDRDERAVPHAPWARRARGHKRGDLFGREDLWREGGSVSSSGHAASWVHSGVPG